MQVPSDFAFKATVVEYSKGLSYTSALLSSIWGVMCKLIALSLLSFLNLNLNSIIAPGSTSIISSGCIIFTNGVFALTLFFPAL